MFNSWFGKQQRKGMRHCRRGTPAEGNCCAHPLCDFMQGVEVRIVSNGDRKTLEMGLCTGATVRIIENRPGDANIVIASGEGRYILDKETAEKIRVR